MGVPTVEKAPGIKEPWLGIWRYALKAMQEGGTWSPPMRPLLDDYVEALRVAREHRRLAETTVQVIFHKARDGKDAWEEELPPGIRRNRESDLDSLHPGFASADREMKRAILLAGELGLTPKAQKALAEKAEEGHDEDPAFAAADRLARGHAPRRRSRVAHS